MIKLHKVIPFPLLENGLNPASNVYNTEGVVFEANKNYLLSAASGKGKSTLIHAIYGLRNDYEGTIFLDTKNVKDYSMDDWAVIRQKKLAIVFQDLRLFLHLTARENIVLKSQLTSDKKAAPSVKTLEEYAERLGIADFLDKPCATLSYGQRQRVAIIRALAQPFDYLLLDEPFSHLDKENIRIASDIINEVCRQQRAGLLLVSLGDTYLFKYDTVFQL
jgi:ABC-type lipoprotein export system ATPase subunit